MRRRVIASLIAIASLSACAHQTPQAMPGMAWSLNNADGEGAKLAFGQANTDNVLVMLTCQPRSGQVMLSANAPNGAKPELQLASRGAQARYVGDVNPDMGEGAVVEAKTHANDPVMVNFAKSGDLAVTVAGRRTTVPADRAKAQQFVESCRA